MSRETNNIWIPIALGRVQRQRSAIAFFYMYRDTCSVTNIASYLGLYQYEMLERVQRMRDGGVL